MTVVVGGGTGFVGRHVAKMLKERGFNVVTISRTSDSLRKKERLTWVDVNSNGLPDNCRAVINVAGENILNPFKRLNSGDYREEIYRSRVETSRILANSITEARHPPEVYVTMSGVGYYPPSPTEEYTEESSGGYDWLGKLSVDWERAGNLPSNVPTRRVIVRSGVVLGMDGGMLQTLKPILFMSTLQKIGSGKQWFPWIHITDMASLLTYAVENENVKGILNGVAPDIVNNETFTNAMAEAFKLKVTFGCVPEFYMKMMFGTERAIIVLNGQKVIPRRTIESGFQYKYPTMKLACAQLYKEMYPKKQ